MPELPGINIEQGLGITQQNYRLYRKLLKKFYDSQGNFENDFRAALKDSDPEAATRCAHTIKGVAGNLGATGIQEAAQKLETGCRENKTSEEIENLLSRVLSELLPVIAGLKVLNKTDADPVGEVVFDRSVIVILISELLDLLESDDTAAANKVEELKNYLKGSGTESALDQVEQYISEYDFEEALVKMQTLVNHFSA